MRRELKTRRYEALRELGRVHGEHAQNKKDKADEESYAVPEDAHPV